MSVLLILLLQVAISDPELCPDVSKSLKVLLRLSTHASINRPSFWMGISQLIPLIVSGYLVVLELWIMQLRVYTGEGDQHT
jgi:hypothetical protein